MKLPKEIVPSLFSSLQSILPFSHVCYDLVRYRCLHVILCLLRPPTTPLGYTQAIIVILWYIGIQ